MKPEHVAFILWLIMMGVIVFLTASIVISLYREEIKDETKS